MMNKLFLFTMCTLLVSGIVEAQVGAKVQCCVKALPYASLLQNRGLVHWAPESGAAVSGAALQVGGDNGTCLSTHGPWPIGPSSSAASANGIPGQCGQNESHAGLPEGLRCRASGSPKPRTKGFPTWTS